MKKILYIDMDNVLVDFQSWIDKLDKETLSLFEGRLDEVPDIFSLMGPLPWAIQSYNLLNKYFNIYILSTSPWNNPQAWQDKLKWVQTYLPSAYKNLILSHNKHLNIWDYLIDDRTKNWAGEFKWELILFWSEQFPDWDSVTKYLLSKL